MNDSQNSLIKDLMSFLDGNPTAWHAVASIAEKLRDASFTELSPSRSWHLEAGKAYFVRQHHSSLCAFILPSAMPSRVRLLASHTDSPSFKLKPQPEIRKHQSILLGVEVYGSPLLTSWLNRDLGLAGRVIYYDSQHRLQESLVRLDKHPLTIPQLAIHLDREVNEKGLLLNKQEHLNVLAGLEKDFPKDRSYLEALLREEIDCEQLINFDLLLFPLEKTRLIGYQQAFLASYRIDSLSSVHAILNAFLYQPSPLEEDIQMMIIWDNEEVGSGTAQGAESPFFNQTLERLLLARNLGREDYFKILSRSHCVSVDLAHALHPNYAERHDAQHQPMLGQGVILKSNAQQRYASDARSSLPLQIAADTNRIPLQRFVSRNDMPCGTTIGPIQASISGISTVDIGSGQLSMHASRELIACQDHLWLCQLLQSLLKMKDWPELNS
ncbi:M18 family aminopeptidase [Candidatus Protochlamydia phocaeensis]|uniref:M18 family aminopeptidase n=1 Tax=Candidatus Protochlamydia phocaeensis TaxID=1414722 RepID=UPI0008388757|nr:M18 family aminopeptidase [Candidatus Protochlamydia phocaeensis]